MKRSVIFNSDHLENSLITSQNVMDLSIGILFVQEIHGILHPPSCMDRPWSPGYRMQQPNILRKLVHSAGRQ